MPSEGPCSYGRSVEVQIGDEILDNICFGCPSGKKADKKLRVLIEEFVHEQAKVCQKCIDDKGSRNCAGKVMYGNYEFNPADLRIRWWKAIKARNITRVGIEVSPSLDDIDGQLRNEEEQKRKCCGEVRDTQFCPECGKKVG